MGGGEFKGYSVQRLQEKFFLQELPKKDGRYSYQSRALNSKEQSVVLFQWDAQIIACATLLKIDNTPHKENGIAYKGAMLFDVYTIKVFDPPLNKHAIDDCWPSFTAKKFNQAKHKLEPELYFDFIRKHSKVRSPHIWLPNDSADEFDEYVPLGLDRRLIVYKQIRERRGQVKFRNALIARYGRQCMITKCLVLDVIEAAHISLYRGKEDNHVTNGLLLRSDIHTLFDLDLLGITPEDLRIEIHPDINSEYANLNGCLLNCCHEYRPSYEALKSKHQNFRARLTR